MKQILTCTLLMLTLLACKSKPADPNAADVAAVAETIHKFAQWANDFSNGPDDDQRILDLKGKYARLDSALLNRYLARIKASGFVSDKYIDTERNFYQKCEPFWMSEDKDEILTGMDENRFFHAQDWDLKQWTTTPVNIIDGLGTDEVTATMNNAEGKPFVTYTLEKETDKWLITSIDSGSKAYYEADDYAGSYYSDEKSCPMELHISLKNGAYNYQWKSGKRSASGLALPKWSESGIFLLFKGLGNSGKSDVEGLFADNSIAIQNAGNAQNKYQIFKECDAKFIHLNKGARPAEKPATAPAATPAPETEKPKTTAKKAAKTLPTVTINRYGDIALSGKKIAIEDLRKALQKDLLTHAVIPDQLLIKPIGEVGMGARHELQTVVSESISGAKWVRKKGALEAVNQTVSKRLNADTQLELNNYQTIGYFALVDARPLYINGNPIDYSISPYKYEYQSGKFADRVIAILKFDKGAWKVLTYTIGANAVPVNDWVKKYGVPRALFEK
ncbi:MAG TPA: hypothetical protein VK168_00360 [Saprospiraceae bacterium]|nr:hypothetical protein [Saprospiraceae bacterium]